MSKTFISASTDRVLVVEGYHGAPYLEIVDGGGDMKSFRLDKSDAPAVALAILEAAGVEPDREPLECQVSLGTIVADLQGTIQYAEALASANREQAELEAEALELFNTLQTEIHGNLGPNWVPVTEFPNIETKRKWLAVARKSRELNKELTNGR